MSVYAVSDLHGRYDLFQKIKDYIKPEDTVYVLGDCADRGESGWKIIKEVYDNPQFIYIKGNHEDLFVRAMRSFFTYTEEEKAFFWRYDPKFQLFDMNGGRSTFLDWFNEGANPEWIGKLNNLCTHITYENTQGQIVELSHAGFNPWDDIFDRDYLWDRHHYEDNSWHNFESTVIVHGHTPILHMDKEISDTPMEKMRFEPYWYADGHKVNIDCGCFATGGTILLNLDTWKYVVFEEDNLKN